MNIEIVQGQFDEAKKYCKSKAKETVFFELSYMDTDEKATVEFNRFIKAINTSDVIGMTVPKRVVINISAWNENYLYNQYIESFFYMLSDIQEGFDYKIICEKEINKGLNGKISDLKLFSFSLTALPTMIKKNEMRRIGFHEGGSGIEVDKNVRV